jgi:general secretion pathway protein I
MRHPRAFTLVEVLLALVIFALTAVVLGGAYVNVLNGYESARQANADDADVDFARSQLLGLSDLTAAQDGAEFDDGDRHVKWTAEIDPAETTDLFTVTFTCVITGGAGFDSKTVAETFMLVRPTWSDPTARSDLRASAATRIAVFQGKQAQ